ncbi:Phosphatidylinositol 5-phosphate 4-kinase type-2 beta, partial [Fasciola hepatica]
ISEQENCHGQTLLPQYLGLYRLTVNDQETYILVMRNVFSPRLTVHKKYDLKVSPSHKPGKNASVRRQHFPDSNISHPNLSNLIVSTAGLTKHHKSAHRRTCSNVRFLILPQLHLLVCVVVCCSL